MSYLHICNKRLNCLIRSTLLPNKWQLNCLTNMRTQQRATSSIMYDIQCFHVCLEIRNSHEENMGNQPARLQLFGCGCSLLQLYLQYSLVYFCNQNSSNQPQLVQRKQSKVKWNSNNSSKYCITKFASKQINSSINQKRMCRSIHRVDA